MSVIFGIIFITLGAFASSVRAQESGATADDSEGLVELSTRGLADRASRWRCEAAVKFHCSVEECRKVEIAVWVNLDFPGRRYERCDSKGCDRYEMIHSRSGIYTIVSPGMGHSTFLKAVNDGSEFMEVASLLTAAHISFGQCAPGR